MGYIDENGDFRPTQEDYDRLVPAELRSLIVSRMMTAATERYPSLLTETEGFHRALTKAIIDFGESDQGGGER